MSPLSSPKPQWRLDAESDAAQLCVIVDGHPDFRRMLSKTSLMVGPWPHTVPGALTDPVGTARAVFRACPSLRGPE